MRGPLLRASLRLSFVLIAAIVARTSSSSCPGASPDDDVPDDAPLQACLAASPWLALDPPSGAAGPGYLLAAGLVIVLDGTTITSTAAPGARAVLAATPALAWPMVSSNATLLGLTLSYLTIDGRGAVARGAVAADLCSAASGATNGNYRTANVMLPGFRFPEPPIWRAWDPWERYAGGVEIAHCLVTGSPCGAGIGISGRDFWIHDNVVAGNGGDPLHNPGGLGFPYADGINAAVCMNGTLERNQLQDNTNMIIVAGPGPYCLVRGNELVQVATASQNGVNVWPTNAGSPPAYWHPDPWNFAHSAVYNNSIRVERSASGDIGIYSGIAVGGLPWSPTAVLADAGLVMGNTIDSVNVGLLVDGVLGGTVWGNTVTRPYSGGSPPNCDHPLAYTAADTNGTLLQPGWAPVQFHQGPCEPAAVPVQSTVDAAAFASVAVNGVLNPSAVSVVCGAALIVALEFVNSGAYACSGAASAARRTHKHTNQHHNTQFMAWRGRVYDNCVALRVPCAQARARGRTSQAGSA
jgi:hypothetical protein